MDDSARRSAGNGGEPAAATKSIAATETLAHHDRRLILFGALTQAEFQNLVRVRCLPEVAKDIEGLLSDWRRAASEFQALVLQKSPLPEDAQSVDVNGSSVPIIRRLEADPLFKATFSQHQYSYRLVEIDKLVAGQREVDLGHVERLIAGFGKEMDESKLAEVCLSPRAELPAPVFQQLSYNAIVYSSTHPGLRFIHGFPKPALVEGDFSLALAGGQPVAAVLMFVGFGTNPVNVFAVGRRLILNNGFHRSYALRTFGATHIPAVVQDIRSPELEMPDVIAGLPKEYLVSHPRPALVGDFFRSGLTTVLRTKPTIRHVKLVWNWEEFNGPAIVPGS